MYSGNYGFFSNSHDRQPKLSMVNSDKRAWGSRSLTEGNGSSRSLAENFYVPLNEYLLPFSLLPSIPCALACSLYFSRSSTLFNHIYWSLVLGTFPLNQISPRFFFNGEITWSSSYQWYFATVYAILSYR